MRKNVSNFVVVAKRPRRSSAAQRAAAGTPPTAANDRVRAALEKMRDWRERGSPEEEIDYSDAPQTTADDWHKAERASFSFENPARARR